jgi:hypothetical protein
LTQQGTYSLIAQFNTLNATTYQSTTATATLIIGKSPTTISVPIQGTSFPASPVVNQPFVFTASVAPTGVSDSATGLAIPSGLVTFQDITAGGPAFCSSAVQRDGTVTCSSHAFATAGTHSILVTYAGDSNFTGITQTIAFGVSQDTPVVAVNSSAPSNISVATQTVVFNATVTPNYPGTGPTNPTAGIVITVAPMAGSTGGTYSCTTPTSTSITSRVDSQSCSITFPANTSGNFSVTAAYGGDSNFTSQTSPAITQTVQNFSVAFAPSAPITAPLTLTQGHSNNGYQVNGSATIVDPFNPVKITVNSTPIQSYTHTLTVACTVTNSKGTAVSDPSCSTSLPASSGATASTTLAGNNGVLAVTISATVNAAVDQYSVVLSATDIDVSNLAQSTPALYVNVVSQSGALSVAPSFNATQNVEFNTAVAPVGTTFQQNSYSCGVVVPLAPSGGGPAPAVPPTGSFTCTGPSQPQSVSTQYPYTTIAINIAVNGTTSASVSPVRQSGSVVTAAFWGVPLLALLAWLSRRNSPRKNFFRFLSMILLVAGLSYTVGCGGSFTPPHPINGGPTPGTYLIQVIAKDSTGANHYAVVPLTVPNSTVVGN